MQITPNPGLDILTERMCKNVNANWRDVQDEILSRTLSHESPNIRDDIRLQKLIVQIYEGFIPVYAQQVWAEHQVNMSPGGQAEHQAIAAADLSHKYAAAGFRKLYHHLRQSEPGQTDEALKNASYKLLGGIIGRSLDAFCKALFVHFPEYGMLSVCAGVDQYRMYDYKERYKPSMGMGR